MQNSLRSTLRRLATEVRGAEIAEAAAVLPLMFMMLLGIFWFGQAFSIYGAITRAAQEGARAGAVPYCTTCTGANPVATNAVNAVNAALAASKLDPNQAAPPTPPPTFSSCNTTSSSCSAASANICVPVPSSVLPCHCNRARCLWHVCNLPVPVPVLAALYLSEQAKNLAHSVSPRANGDSVICFPHLRNLFNRVARSGWRNDHAAQLVEFAVALPLLVVFVVGIFDFSNAFTIKQKLTNVARDAARAAAADPANDLQSPRRSGVRPRRISRHRQLSGRQQAQRLRHQHLRADLDRPPYLEVHCDHRLPSRRPDHHYQSRILLSLNRRHSPICELHGAEPRLRNRCHRHLRHN